MRDHHAGGLRLPRHVHDPHPARSRGGASNGDESLDLPNKGLFFQNILINILINQPQRVLESLNFPTKKFSRICQPIHKANSDFVRVERIHFSLRMTTRSQTGHSDMQTPFCHRQGSVQSASMGEHEIRLERFLLKHLIRQRNATTEYLRHWHV